MYIKSIIVLFILTTFFRKAENARAQPVLVIKDDGSYSLKVHDKTWLESAPTFFIIDGTKYTTADDSLLFIGKNTTVDGTSKFGAQVLTHLYYMAGNVTVTTTLGESAYSVVTFKAHFPNGATNTSSKNANSVICGFPGFKMDESLIHLNFMSFGGEDSGFERQRIGRWGEHADIQDGLEGSSLLTLFDASYNALTIGPVDNFMASSVWRDSENNFLYWGMMGGINDIPRNFSYQLMISYVDGITDSFDVWGFILKSLVYKDHTKVFNDVTKTLGYWTSEGSYYFDKPDSLSNSTYEDVLLDVFQDAKSKNIPYRYIELDTWCFIKGESGGVKQWNASLGTFPNGLESFHSELGVSIVAKNNYWSSDNVYAEQNGGTYNFDIQGNMALPLEETFWDDIFIQSKKWGLSTYIQDNMTEIFRTFPAMSTDLNYGQDWLMKMNTAAISNNVTIQFSSALPRMSLASFVLPAVQQLRISSNYASDPNQWKIGLATLLAETTRPTIFKDIFRTDTGSDLERESLVSTLSMGMIGIGDEVGQSNVPLIMRSTSADGTLLTPNVPAAMIDLEINIIAINNLDIAKTQIWSTFSSVSYTGADNTLQFGIIFISNMEDSLTITPKLAGYSQFFQRSVIYLATEPTKTSLFTNNNSYTLAPCVNTDFCLYYTSPDLTYNQKQLIIIGEEDKWVPMSYKRGTNITISDVVSIQVKGQAQENVTISFTIGGVLKSRSVVIDQTGFGTIVYKEELVSTTTPSKPATTTPHVNAASAFSSALFTTILLLVFSFSL